ncbi:MAG: hypothetical protein IJ482_04000 [Alphaproteobacteria bacterium]|nr:hypothetical protein [Alphaproteobacteria bacterium]
MFYNIRMKNMTITKRILTLCAVCGLLSGCAYLFPSDNEELPRYTEPRYDTEEPIQLKVSKINVISEFTPSFTRPHVEHLFPVSIEKTAKLWANDRLKAVDFSSPNVADVIIKDASVTETLEPNDKMWAKDRVKYKAKLIVALRIHNPDNMSEATTQVEGWRELTIDAGTDIAEKEQYWSSMVDKLFDDYNNKMTANVYQYLNLYVVNQPLVPTYY